MAENETKQIIQTVTFYNTTGFIEKEQNIYFVPQPEDLLGTHTQHLSIAQRYVEKLNSVCPPSSSNYTNIALSRWSPEDRALSVRGTIDNFRKGGSPESLCMNYMIVHRVVSDLTGLNILYDYYIGFFIVGYAQTGTNTVRLDIEPDHFTNVFYLMNTTEYDEQGLLEGYFEPFNALMNHCHINRQHYDRVELINNLRVPANLDLFLNTEESYKFKYQKLVSRNPISFNKATYSSAVVDDVSNFTQKEVNAIKNTERFNDLSSYLKNKIIASSIGFAVVKCKERLSAQGISWTSSTQTNVYDTQPNGAEDERGLITSTCQTLVLPTIIQNKLFDKYSTVLNKIVFNAEVSVRWVKKHRVSGESTYYTVEYTSPYTQHFASSVEGQDSIKLLTLSAFSYASNYNAWSDRILSLFLLKDIDIPYDITNISSTPVITFYAKNEGASDFSDLSPEESLSYGRFISNNLRHKPLDVGLWATFVTYDLSQISSNETGIALTVNKNTESVRDLTPTTIWRNEGNRDFCLALEMSGNIPISKMIRLEETKSVSGESSNYVDIKSQPYEPVLESSPYTYYSMYYVGGLSTILDKRLYYETGYSNLGYYDIPVRFISSNNDALKYSVIPSFTRDGVSNEYYSSGFIITLQSQLPIKSNSYASFYSQNMAQMKNQYATNDYQRGTDLAQTFFNTAPAKVGQGFLKGGSAGGFSELIGQVSGMIDMGIDWAQSNNVIGMKQKAMLSDANAKPDTIKQVGSDVFYDIATGEFALSLEYYRIDDYSYNSICKYLQRYGYYVDRFDTLNVYNRVGWNYIKLDSLSFKEESYYPEDVIKLSDEQMSAIIRIMLSGVTLIHNRDIYYSSDYGNYEKILKEE